MARITHLNIYPLKSTQAQALEKVQVMPRGLQHDRRWALINSENRTITGRDFPKLLDLSVKTEAQGLQVLLSGEKVLSVALPTTEAERVAVHVFSNSSTALVAESAVNQWFSDYLNTAARLVFMDEDSERALGAKYGGTEKDTVSLADEAPVLLISAASLGDLNERLEQPVTMAHFRPNIIVEDTEPFAEDKWKRIRIGTAEFKAGRQCKRCIFTTIDPITKQKNAHGEPLRTLSTYRKQDGGVIFGQLFIPVKMGEIKVGDRVEVVKD